MAEEVRLGSDWVVSVCKIRCFGIQFDIDNVEDVEDIPISFSFLVDLDLC